VIPISPPGDGLVYHFEPGSLVRFKVLTEATGGAFEMYEREVPPHTIGADPHLHGSTVETFYVVEGHVTILAGESRAVYGPGSVVVVPRNTVHGFWNETGEPIKLLISFVPGLHHHKFFEGLAELKAGPPEAYAGGLAALRRRFDSQSI